MLDDLDPQDKERSARTACRSGDFQTGVSLLADLYVATDNLTCLSHQARCFGQNVKYADTIIRFREHQRKNRGTGMASDAEVKRHIPKCEALAEKARAQARMAPPALAPAWMSGRSTARAMSTRAE